jgi:DNA invertase Pin-like site-specific DNA recombinase
MLPGTKELIREVAERHGVEIDDVVSPYGARELTPIRSEVTHTLKNNGYTVSNIARLLKRDRHTIYDWLTRPNNT